MMRRRIRFFKNALSGENGGGRAAFLNVKKTNLFSVKVKLTRQPFLHLSLKFLHWCIVLNFSQIDPVNS